MLLWILRGSFIAIVIGMATYACVYFYQGDHFLVGIGAFAILLLLALAAVAGDLLIRDKQITTISAVSFGLLLGLVIGALFSMALEPFLSDSRELAKLAQPLRLLITVVCCYFFVSTLL